MQQFAPSAPKALASSKFIVCERDGCGNRFRRSTQRTRFCCWDCYIVFKTSKRFAPCVICKKIFDNKNSTGKKYCSAACQRVARRMNLTVYTCHICDSPLDRNWKLYCSKKCKAIARAVAQQIRPPRSRKGIKVHKPRTPTEDDLALYARVMQIGTRAAGAEINISKCAVNGRMHRCGLSTKNAPHSHQQKGIRYENRNGNKEAFSNSIHKVREAW